MAVVRLLRRERIEERRMEEVDGDGREIGAVDVDDGL